MQIQCERSSSRARVLCAGQARPARESLVSGASRIFLFPVGGARGRKNTSGHSGQLPVPRRNVIIAFMAACHVHGMQIKTFIQLGVTILCSLYPNWQTIATENDPASTR